MKLNTPKHSQQRYPLLYLLAALAAGICVDRWLSGAVTAPVWLALALGALGSWWYLVRHRRWLWFPLFFAWAALGAARHHDHWNCYPEHDVANLELEFRLPVAIRCQLLTSPEASPLADPNPLSTLQLGVQSRFNARVLELRNRQEWEQATGRIAVRVDGHVLQHTVGDVVQVYGMLSRIPGPMNPGESDRRLSQRNRRTWCRLHVTHPDCIASIRSASQTPAAWLGRLRDQGLAHLDYYVGSPRSALAGALLLGARDRLDYDRVEQFFHTGTLHLLAISGLHVGILAWGFFFLANRTSSRQTILLVLMLGTVVYCHLTGLRAPVMRAAVLVMIVCLSQLWRRKFSPLNALAAAAFVILLYRPGAIALPGAQLSFLAVATLTWLASETSAPTLEPLEKLVLSSRPAWRRGLATVFQKTGQLAWAGMAIWIATLPLTMYWFHLCSPVGLALNVVLTVPVTLGLLSGFGVLLSGSLVSPIAFVCGRLCAACLAFVEAVVALGHTLPGAFFWVSQTSAIWCGAFYVALAGLLVAPMVHFNKRLVVAWLALWLAIPILGDWTQRRLLPKQDELRCTFLSVGHGTCAVLEMPDDRLFIYDAGRMGIPDFGVNVVSEFLWSRGRTHVDGILMSHADADHYNLVPGLLKRFTVGEVFVSSRMWQDESPGIQALRQSINDASVPIREIQTNDRLVMGSTARVLHPFAEGVVGSDNANSIVLEVEFQGRRLLLPGDLESPGLEDVLAEMPRDVDLVMAAHHGSLRSEPEAFMRWCTPEFVVISGRRDGENAPQQEEFRQTGATVLHTAYDGAVTATIKNHEIYVETFLSGPALAR